jgi:hypothetical protein
MARTCKSVAGDPSTTLAVHCGNGFDARFKPYQSTRLGPIQWRPLSLGVNDPERQFATRHRCNAAVPLAHDALCRLNRSLAQSNTSSEIARSVGGTVRPSAFAVLRLIASSNLVGCSTGSSEGLAPLRTLTRMPAACSNIAGRLGP